MQIDFDDSWKNYTRRLPNDSKAIAVVTQEGQTGALVFNKKSQCYQRVNGGTAYSLDQKAVIHLLSELRASRTGGNGLGQGRTTEDGSNNLLRKQVKLDEESIRRLKSLGGGNLSLGIRLAAKHLP